MKKMKLKKISCQLHFGPLASEVFVVLACKQFSHMRWITAAISDVAMDRASVSMPSWLSHPTSCHSQTKCPIKSAKWIVTTNLFKKTTTTTTTTTCTCYLPWVHLKEKKLLQQNLTLNFQLLYQFLAETKRRVKIGSTWKKEKRAASSIMKILSRELINISPPKTGKGKNHRLKFVPFCWKRY